MAASPSDEILARQAAELAARMWSDAQARKSRRERRRDRLIERLLEDERSLAFVLALTDEVMRIRDPRRAARRLRDLVARMGEPAFLGPLDRWLVRTGCAVAPLLPGVVVALTGARVRRELAPFVVPAAARPFKRYIRRRRRDGFRINVNLLGEEVLGDEEADRRLAGVTGLLARPDVDYVSVKVSSVCAQLVPAAFEVEVERVSAQLRRLYRAALAHQPAKFVNLDMESYRDLRLTVAAFETVLDEPEFHGLEAGIVLQAYIPDSTVELAGLVPWARRRRERGGGRVKVRLVKGANLAMERVTAELAGWSQPPYEDKADVDANYKRMLDLLLDPANQDALRVGVASHNVFEAAWALTVAEARGVAGMVEMEMLQGMAPSLAEVVKQRAGGLLLYAPVVPTGNDESSIAYLVRRFDENTGPDNFLRHQFSMSPGSPAWEAEEQRFAAAVKERHRPTVATRMTQDRSENRYRSDNANEPDTDFSLAANRAWIAPYLDGGSLKAADVPVIPAVIAGETLSTGEELATGVDPYRPTTPLYHWVRATPTQVDRAVATAHEALAGWHAEGHAARQRLLEASADELCRRRGDLIAVMARDGGKTLGEADPEVSEAVDYCRYYAACVDGLAELDGAGASFQPFGVVAVIPPWNFPLAIPAGGVAAALAAGNTVVLKPAPETVAVAWHMANAFWDAGVPREVLQFVPCADGEAGRTLVTHPQVAAVILTGSWETARMFLGWRPDLRLRAETSGKNAMVITAAADLDQAVSDLVRSAFSHAGQKCSAASLAIVEASVYDDPRFLRQLADAVSTLQPGPGWDPAATIGPLIRPPEGPLRRALDHLDEGESWLVHPGPVDGHPNLYRPGVKLGVRPGSFFHLTECFGPVLGLMRAAGLEEAIRLQNTPAFGLTAGIQSLDPAEIARWEEAVEAGNLYVNRHTTGAIVRRQPFGGWKRSSIGPGAKAGGPNYVASLGTWSGAADAAAGAVALEPSDPTGLAAESNVLRYRPYRAVLLRVAGVAEEDLRRALAVAQGLGVNVTVSYAAIEDDAELAARLPDLAVEKVRFLGPAAAVVRLAAYDAGLDVDDTPVVAVARLEALRWVREQAVSRTRHRHGNPIRSWD